MHLKTKKVKNHVYLSIVQSYRENGKVKHKTIFNLGRADYLVNSGLKNIVRGLQRYLDENDADPYKKDISTIKERQRLNYGYLAYRVLWKKFRLDQILLDLVKNRQIEFNFPEAVFSMVINRLFNPSSKLRHYLSYQHYIGLAQKLELHHFYRSLDILAENKERIEKELFQLYRTLFNYKLDIVFYDVTTYYFESQKANGLKDFGFSKDNKINDVQIVMGLLIDKEGRPIGYELFPGNTFDGKTLLPILKKLQAHFKIDKVVIVADRGLNSRLNLKYIKDHGFDYIVSASIKKMSQKLQDLILDPSDYQDLKEQNDEDEDGVYRYKVIEYTNRVAYEKEQGKKAYQELGENLICTYSSKRASKDRADRERAIEKAKELLKKHDKSSYQRKQGYKRYIKESKKAKTFELVLDTEKIERESRFDGYYAIQCSDKSMSALEVIQRYHNLFKIEESFRIIKSTMKARPIYVWNESHIAGHFMMCFLAFLLERELEYRLKRRDISFSTEKIKEALNSLELSEIEIEGQNYYMRSSYKSLGAQIFSMLRLKLPPNLLDKERISSYVNL